MKTEELEDPIASAEPVSGGPDAPMDAESGSAAAKAATGSDEVAEPAGGAGDREPPAPPGSLPNDPKTTVDPMHLIASVLIAVTMVMVLWAFQPSSRKNANTGSRYATIEALVDHGTFFIDKTHYKFTPDKLEVGKHLVSTKPPLLPTWGAGVYWVYQKLTGHTIADHEGEIIAVVTLFTAWLSHLIFLIYFYRLCRLLIKRQLAIIVALVAACFAYFGTAYASHLNNHSVAAAFLLVGFYYAVRIRNELGAKTRHWIIAGLVLGILPAIDLPSLSFTGLVWLYLVSYDYKRTLLIFSPALIPGFAAQLVLSYLSTGYLVPAYMNRELLDAQKHNYFSKARSGIDALREPKTIYSFNMLLGHHGLFSMTPLFVFSLIDVIRRLVRRQRYFAEALVVLVANLVVILFYVFKSRNYGGWCVGMRWLIPQMALLLVHFALWLDQARLGKLKWTLVVGAFVVSTFHVQDAFSSPFQFSRWHNFLEGAPNRNRLSKKLNLGRAYKRAKRRARRKRREKRRRRRSKQQKQKVRRGSR